MQFIKSKKQVITCPQCDNVVRIDADFCNICGQPLRGTSSKPQLVKPAAAIAPPQPAATEQIEEEEEEYEYEEEEEEYEEEEDAELLSDATSSDPVIIPSAPGEILNLLQHLQDHSAQIDRYFPADLPGKALKLSQWKKQLQRAYTCAETP